MSDSVVHTTRTILAAPRVVYRAFLDPEAVVYWRLPKGMTAKIYRFDPRVGGGYRISNRGARDPVRRKAGQGVDDRVLRNPHISDCVPVESALATWPARPSLVELVSPLLGESSPPEFPGLH